MGRKWVESPEGQAALRRIVAYDPGRPTPGRSTAAARMAVRTQLRLIQNTAEGARAAANGAQAAAKEGTAASNDVLHEVRKLKDMVGELQRDVEDKGDKIDELHAISLGVEVFDQRDHQTNEERLKAMERLKAEVAQKCREAKEKLNKDEREKKRKAKEEEKKAKEEEKKRAAAAKKQAAEAKKKAKKRRDGGLDATPSVDGCGNQAEDGRTNIEMEDYFGADAAEAAQHPAHECNADGCGNQAEDACRFCMMFCGLWFCKAHFEDGHRCGTHQAQRKKRRLMPFRPHP